jgi:hypothetical protein
LAQNDADIVVAARQRLKVNKPALRQAMHFFCKDGGKIPANEKGIAPKFT